MKPLLYSIALLLPAVACAEAALHQILLNPLEPGADIHTGSWNLDKPYVIAAEDLEPQMGAAALTFGGDARVRQSKGDFRVANKVPGEPQQITFHAHLAEDANVKTLGLQLSDNEGEVFILHVPANWIGWKQLQFDLTEVPLKQARPQPEKNNALDFPIHAVRISWFTHEPGPSYFGVDGLTAITQLEETPEQPLAVNISVPEEVKPNDAPEVAVFFMNYEDAPVELRLQYSLQRNSHFWNEPLPDPVYGSNHAPGSRGWTEYEGKRLEDSKSVDGQVWTVAEPLPYTKNHYTEANQLIDLGELREIKRMKWQSGNANATWFVDVYASHDGESFEAIEELQNIDMHKKWGERSFPDFEPFQARWLKFHYRVDGEKKNSIHFPTEIMVFDGAEDEFIGIPAIGEVLQQEDVLVSVPARSYAPVFIDLPPLDRGTYMLGLDIEADGFRYTTKRNIFTTLPHVPGLIHEDGRIGLNTSRPQLSEFIAEAGASWVRFENGKWPFVSNEPHKYQYNPGVKPWSVNFDDVFKGYHDLGINTLTYMFLVPEWASQPGPDVPERVKLSQPPKNLADYGEFTFQTAARYASRKHPPEELKTEDKVSGLSLVKAYNMYNEPNLNAYYGAPRGGWAAPMDLFYQMMRYGVEGVRRADPDAIVTGPSLAGMTVDVVDMMRTYTYEDGKHPIDLVDIICVHFYAGHNAPETSRVDGNSRLLTEQTFPENMRELSAWRDRYGPGKPIWMTETGFDSAGPFGTNETIQAARLPRQVMLALAYGAEKVFVYREAGDAPSRHAAAGLLRSDHSKKPSWYTFGTMTRQFRNVEGGAIRLPYADDNVWLLLWNDGGAPLVTAWTVDGEANIDLDFGPCTLTDAFGAARELETTADLKLSPYPSYLRGFSDTTMIGELKSQYDSLEQLRQQRIEEVAALRKYLFDFGSSEQVGTFLMDGHKTPYQTVDHEALWDDGKAYGFDRKAQSVTDRKYMGNRKAARDSVKINGQVFSFKAQPGRYKLVIKAEPFFADEADVTVRYGAATALNLTVDKENLIRETEITLANPDARVEIDLNNIPANLYYISLIEMG